MSVLVQATELYRYYGRHCAVNNLSFTLNKGDVLGFLGINGAGKTTTMQMLCGNLVPNRGEIRINNIDMLQQPRIAKQYLGYLPEHPPLYKELNINEFLHYCAQLHRVPKNKIQAAIGIAKEKCGLESVAKRLIAQLSKGYQQRVGIAQAILHNPPVIILDEPTVGLDPIQIKEMRQLIQQLGQDHALILSTHILSEVQEVCTHLQIIHHGQLILAQTMAELNAETTSTSLKLVTEKAIDISALMCLIGITQIDKISDYQYLIQHSNNCQPIEAVTALILDSGWGLKEITPLKQTLEDIFIRLTHSQQKT